MEKMASILSLKNIPLNDLNMKKLLYEDSLIATKLRPKPEQHPNKCSLTFDFFHNS